MFIGGLLLALFVGFVVGWSARALLYGAQEDVR